MPPLSCWMTSRFDALEGLDPDAFLRGVEAGRPLGLARRPPPPAEGEPVLLQAVDAPEALAREPGARPDPLDPARRRSGVQRDLPDVVRREHHVAAGDFDARAPVPLPLQGPKVRRG